MWAAVLLQRGRERVARFAGGIGGGDPGRIGDDPLRDDTGQLRGEHRCEGASRRVGLMTVADLGREYTDTLIGAEQWCHDRAAGRGGRSNSAERAGPPRDGGQRTELTVWEAFKIYDGQIHAVEAFMKNMPVGLGSGWPELNLNR